MDSSVPRHDRHDLDSKCPDSLLDDVEDDGSDTRDGAEWVEDELPLADCAR